MARGIKGISKDKALEIISQRIIEDTRDYWDGYRKPLQYSKLRIRISGLLSQFKFNLLDEVKEMDRMAKVKLLISERLARFVVPYGIWEGLNLEERVDLLEGINPAKEKARSVAGKRSSDDLDPKRELSSIIKPFFGEEK